VCVRFNRHAVYLGTPGTDESCPVHAVGRTEAILVMPTAHGTTAADSRNVLAPTSTAYAAPDGGTMATVVNQVRRVAITATWSGHPATIRRALGLRSLHAALSATNGHRPLKASANLRSSANPRPRTLPRTTSPGTPAAPGAVYNGLGFDTCTTQSAASMAAWGASSPYAAVGIYIGGANAACVGGNLTASWVSTESAAGWHMVPTYVGLQAPIVGGTATSSCKSCAAMSATATTAATQGTAAAQDATAQAQALGIGTGNPIYFDLESYLRGTVSTASVLAFLQAWTQQLHASGYLSGVYSSGASGIADLASQYGTAYVEPDDLWTASWDYSQPSTPPNSPTNPYVPTADWPNNQQLLQYYGGHNETYGNVTINIDNDYIDAATAAYGTGPAILSDVAAAPSLKIQPQANGTVAIRPFWLGAQGIASYQILGGPSATALAPVTTVPASRKRAVTVDGVYPYFEVQGLNSTGSVVGSSTPIQAPSSVAIFGNSAFVGTSGPVGIPAACLNTPTCQVSTAIFVGRRRLAQTTSAQQLPASGGVTLVPLTRRDHLLVADAVGRRLPVTVTVKSTAGPKASRSLNLVPYATSGPAPVRRTGSSATLQILGKSVFVSNGWVGGVLALCKSATPCVATSHVTRGGVALAKPTTQTLGTGEIGYMTFTLTPHGRALLMASKGNQYGARVTLTTAAPSNSGGSATTAVSSAATALVSLSSYR
jgi:hypothetical protein